MRRRSDLAGILPLALALASQAEAQGAAEAYDRLSQGDCRGAVAAYAESAQDPVGIYEIATLGAALCCGGGADADRAEGARMLRSVLDALSPAAADWARGRLAACESTAASATDEALRWREVWTKWTVVYRGKVLEGCAEENLSPLGTASDLDRTPDYVVPDPETGTVSPPPDRLSSLGSDYPGAAIAVCPPFLMVSATQDPHALCTNTAIFLRFLRETYGLPAPPVWIDVINLPSSADLAGDMARHGLESCPGALGYFDSAGNRIAFAALPGWFGTLHHELTHAAVHWGAPGLPLWFEEGLAALYENAEIRDGAFCGTANPWRTERLAESHLGGASLAEGAEAVAALSVFDFAHDRYAATVARETLRAIQDGGDLPQLYRALDAMDIAEQGGGREGDDFVFGTPTEVQREAWRAAVAESLQAESALCR